MKCPYCDKAIDAMTGLQELKKFQTHLIKCKKYPKRHVLPARRDEDGFMEKAVNLTCVSLTDALEIRAESGQ